MKKTYIIIGGIIAALVFGVVSFHFLVNKNSVSNGNLGAVAMGTTPTPTGSNSTTPSSVPSLIPEGTLTLLTPVGGSIYQGGQAIIVRWSAVGVPNETVAIYLGIYMDGNLSAYSQVASATSDIGQATVTLPANLDNLSGAAFGDNFKILITANNTLGNVNASAVSGLFTIKAPVISKTAPGAVAGSSREADACKGLVGCLGQVLWKLISPSISGSVHQVTSSTVQSIINWVGSLFGGSSHQDYTPY